MATTYHGRQPYSFNGLGWDGSTFSGAFGHTREGSCSKYLVNFLPGKQDWEGANFTEEADNQQKLGVEVHDCTMKVFIFGLAHGVQAPGGACSTTQKSKYKKFLNQLIKKRLVDFIGEEVSPGDTTIASELANSLGILWQPIDMNESEKNELGVPKEGGTEPQYMGADACTQLTEEGYQRKVCEGWVETEFRHPTDKTRDEFMFDRVISGVGDAKSVLVICGYNHLLQLKQKFRQAGHEVQCDALYKYSWFGS